jgi:hypothetical protein
MAQRLPQSRFADESTQASASVDTTELVPVSTATRAAVRPLGIGRVAGAVRPAVSGASGYQWVGLD